MRALLVALTVAATAIAARPAAACSIKPTPSAIVLGDRAATADRPLLAVARLPRSPRLVLRGPTGTIPLDLRGRFAQPRTRLRPGATYRIVLRGRPDRELGTFTVATQPGPAPSAWPGIDVRGAGTAPPRSTCEAFAWAVDVALRPLPSGAAPTGFLYVYDQRPNPRAPLAGLRGVVPATVGALRLGRVGINLSFEPSWGGTAPTVAWVALGDGAGRLGPAERLPLP